jgi:hypothetical protein
LLPLSWSHAILLIMHWSAGCAVEFLTQQPSARS